MSYVEEQSNPGDAPSGAASPAVAASPGDGPPVRSSLASDRSFLGMTATQFLGAFNDNLFKQVAQLICVDAALRQGGSNQQSTALFLFALPFVLFSGFAGYLSDRYSKRTIIVLCKAAEIVIVTLGTIAIWRNSQVNTLYAIFAALFLLGTHSAFFGPSKYGILPELIHESKLPAANGLFLMTTFLAIILGSVAGGLVKQYLVPGQLLLAWMVYVSIAVAGLAASLQIRPGVAANHHLRINLESLFISRDMVTLLRCDRQLLLALLMSSVFWMVGGVVQPSVNDFGKHQLGLSDSATSLMLVTMVIGIALGCVLGGWLSGKRANFRLVLLGAWGMIIGSAVLSLLGAARWSSAATIPGACVALFLCGTSAGMYAVPLQVFLQTRPPADKKGQMMGAMNLANWIAILLSSVLYGGFHRLLVKPDGSNTSLIFGVTALFLVPIALFYRPRSDG